MHPQSAGRRFFWPVTCPEMEANVPQWQNWLPGPLLFESPNTGEFEALE
jgi:hypothetical protein